MGLLREDKALTNRFLRTSGAVESIRRQIQKNTVIREKISTSVDLPLSNESKRVLTYAASVLSTCSSVFCARKTASLRRS